MRKKYRIVGIKHIVSNKKAKVWTIYFIDITDEFTDGIAVAAVWSDEERTLSVGDEANTLCVNGRYYLI